PLREIALVLGVRDRAGQAAALEPHELAAKALGLQRDLARRRERAIAALPRRAERAERVQHPLLDLAPDARRPERVVVRAAEGRNRDAAGGERRRKLTVEGETLERVVPRAHAVEVAPEPAGVAARG